MATRVADDPRAAAFELAREIAEEVPDAVRGGKRLLDVPRHRTIAEQLRARARGTIGSLIGSPNQVEAVTAFFEKRDAKFEEA